MIQVFRQIENKQSSVFNTISNGKKGEHRYPSQRTNVG